VNINLNVLLLGVGVSLRPALCWNRQAFGEVKRLRILTKACTCVPKRVKPEIKNSMIWIRFWSVIVCLSKVKIAIDDTAPKLSAEWETGFLAVGLRLRGPPACGAPRRCRPPAGPPSSPAAQPRKPAAPPCPSRPSPPSPWPAPARGSRAPGEEFVTG